jgi:hypothetical protein
MSEHPGFRLGALRGIMSTRYGVDPYRSEERPQRLLEGEHAKFLPERFDGETFAGARIPLLVFALQWSLQITRGLPHLLSLAPGRVMHLAYADLLADPEDTIRRFQEFVDGEVDDGWVRESAHEIRPNTRVVDRKLPLFARQACESGMRALGEAGLVPAAASESSTHRAASR